MLIVKYTDEYEDTGEVLFSVSFRDKDEEKCYVLEREFSVGDVVVSKEGYYIRSEDFLFKSEYYESALDESRKIWDHFLSMGFERVTGNMTPSELYINY
jgi:hypothetical protein